MKLLKLTSLMCALAMVSACSLTPKGEESSADYGDSDKLEASDGFSEKPGAAKEPEQETPPTMTPSRSSTSALDEAIQSNNDEAIHRTAIGVLSQNPQDIKALNAAGLYHYRKGQLAAAQLMFNKGLRANPNVSELHNNLGLVFLAQKEYRPAIKAFRKALELNSRDGAAAANIGSIYISEKDYTKARVAMEIAYKKFPKDVRVLNNYGIALTATGDYTAAKDKYKDALKLQSSNKEVMLNYAILLIDHMKQGNEGLDIINKLRFLGPSPEARNRINTLENKVKSGLK